MKYFLLLLVTLLNLQSGYAMNSFDFKKDVVPSKPNHYLICPANYCKTKPNQQSPVFSMSVKQLANYWEQVMTKQPRVTVINKKVDAYHYFYMQRSKVFKFPDFITVQLIPIDEHHSTIAMYSQAKYGYYDFDVNQKRLVSWLDALKK